MDNAQKTALGVAIAVTAFVLGTAVYTGNGALYLLAGLTSLSALLVWQQRKAND